MDLTFNGLDLIFYFVGWAVVYCLIPDQFKEELGGATVGRIVFALYTIAYFILFFFHYDIQFNIVPQ